MDFKELSTLLRDVKEESDSELKRRQNDKDQEQRLFPRIDRIILYVDDLDRCPAKNVVEVLQAVNLLLAFPLFVVVVGVDPRWLVHSLEQHSAILLPQEDVTDPDEDPHWQSTALNYLEKIFQIPYTLRPMDSAGFSRLVNTLSGDPDGGTRSISELSQSTAKASDDVSSRSAGRSAGQPGEAHGPKNAVSGAGVVDRKPEHLRIDNREQSFMKLLHELIPSPRAGKRFMNIYRLIRASVLERERVEFAGADEGGYYQCALLLLAILTGYPAEATEILRDLIFNVHTESWWEFVDNLKAGKSPQPAPEYRDPKVGGNSAPKIEAGQYPRDGKLRMRRWTELFSKLDRLRRFVHDQPCAGFVKWAPRIARYSFESGRVLLMVR